jgi:amidohydrolase
MTNTEVATLLKDAEALLPKMVDIRRRLHRRPEVGLHLRESQAVVIEELEHLSLTPVLGRSTTSVVTRIVGALPGPTILLRADMDALPLMEESGLEFASEIAGVMHACGHDTHIAMLLGAARLLVERSSTLSGGVLLMFQPGEEGLHGAKYMLDEGLLEMTGESTITGAFALHISTLFPTGTINVRPGPMLAAADTLRITVRGRGGHASAPHTAIDSIAAAAQIVTGLQMMVTRRIDVFDPAVITITHVVAGTTHNVIPESVLLEGTIRTFSGATRILVHEEIRRAASGMASALGATAEIDIDPGYPVTTNDPSFEALVRSTASELLGPNGVPTLDAPLMAAEDFSYVLQRVPGAMAFLGARSEGSDPATTPSNHSGRVIFDEAAMPVGAATYTAVALRHLAAHPTAP